MQIPTSESETAHDILGVSPLERARLIAFPEFLHLTGDGKTTAFEKFSDPTSNYPKPIKVGRSNRFLLGEVLDYIHSLVASRDAAKCGAK